MGGDGVEPESLGGDGCWGLEDKLAHSGYPSGLGGDAELAYGG